MTIKMSFTLQEVDPAKDFAELIECEWDSYENPRQTFFRLFCPIHGTGSSARDDSLKEATSRQLYWHQSDPTSYWQKVVNENGKIVAGALWKICPTNPFAQADDHSEVSWYPKGGERDYVAHALKQFEAPRIEKGQRPQVCTCFSHMNMRPGSLLKQSLSDLNIIFTHPDYRRQGIADIIMKWGIEKADAMGVEMWLDATEYGVPLYQKHGFVVVHKNNLAPKKDNPSKEWKDIAKRLEPMIMWQMWRPIRGNYAEGETVRPWV